MNWIFFSLLAPFFWTLSNFVDKHVLNKHTKGIFDFLFFSTISSLFFFFIILFFVGWPELTIYSFTPIATGIILIASYGFYGKALEQEDTSALVILFKLIPVITVILAFIFLGQTLSSKEMFGFIIVLIGALIVSLGKNKKIRIKSLSMIIIAILLWAIMALLVDYGMTKMTFGNYLLLDTLGSILTGPLLFLVPFARKQIIQGLKTAVANKYFWFLGDNFLDFLGQIGLKKALALSPSAGLVTVLTQVQSFYAIILGILLTLFLPNIIKEDILPRNLIKKFIGALIMFFGIYILLT